MPYVGGRADTSTLPTVPRLTRRAAAVSRRAPSEQNRALKADVRVSFSASYLLFPVCPSCPVPISPCVSPASSPSLC